MPTEQRLNPWPKMVWKKSILNIKPLVSWFKNERLRFLALGGVNTVFGYGVFLTLYLILGGKFNYLIIAAVAHVIATSWAFYWHRNFVFRSTGFWPIEFIRYNIGLAWVFLLSVLLLFALVSGLGLHPVVAQAIAIFLSLVLSYFTHRHFSFRRP